MELTPAQTKAQALLRKAHLALQRGRIGAAARFCHAALTLTPDDAIALELMGDILLRQRRWDQAIERYERALAAAPDDPALREKYESTVHAERREEQQRGEGGCSFLERWVERYWESEMWGWRQFGCFYPIIILGGAAVMVGLILLLVRLFP